MHEGQNVNNAALFLWRLGQDYQGSRKHIDDDRSVGSATAAHSDETSCKFWVLDVASPSLGRRGGGSKAINELSTSHFDTSMACIYA